MDISALKQNKILLINDYDKSQAVNSFYLNDKLVWLDKSTRVGLMNSLNVEKLLGKTYTTMWLGEYKYETTIDNAITLLSILEEYAKQCYNVTHTHIRNILESTDENYILKYNYTTEYPERPVFNI